MAKQIDIDSILTARQMVEDNTTLVEKTQKGMKFALITFGCEVAIFLFAWLAGIIRIDFFKNIFGSLASLSFLAYFVMLIVTIAVGGGSKVIHSLFSTIAWGWFVIPIFPIDLIVVFWVAFIGFAAFFMLPPLFIWNVGRKAKKELAAAQDYINRYEAEINHMAQAPYNQPSAF